MNSRQKEILQSQLDSEQAVLKKLKGIYKKALDDVNNNIAALMGRTDAENLQSVIYQLQYQKALKTQINGILDTLNGEQFNTIADYLSKSYEDGFAGAMYDLHGQGIPLIFPIDQDQVVRAIQHDTKLSKSLYDSLGEDISLLKKRIQNNISRGIAQGSSYADVARNVASGMVGDYTKMRGGALGKAYTIARTEGHRITNEAAYEAQKKAKEKGADVVKQWDAAMDKRTRPSHARVDGEIRELDEPFSNGLIYPGDSSGSAAEVINCRCACLQRARWALDEDELQTLKDRAEYFGLDKTDSFEDFKKKYLDASKNADTMNVEEYDVLTHTQKLKGAMNSSDYDEYMTILTEHDNASLRKTYAKYADQINKVQCEKDGGYYSPSENSLVFSYPLQKYIDNGRSKYHTLAHEYGHFFDAKATFEGLHFKEIETIYSKTKYQMSQFKKIASSSDEFLTAVRKDRTFLRSILTTDVEKELKEHDASCGVQDAVDGLLGRRLRWGHGNKYYDRKYNSVKKLKEHKGLQEAYKELGIDASNLGKVAYECRVYESASEMWANISSAEVNGGSELEYVKKYLPNSYEAFIKILKGVK